MVIDEKVVEQNGKTARLGIGAVTISDDRETIYYGSMNGTNWYKIPTLLLCEGKDDRTLSASVVRVGPHPLADDASIDSKGNHYFTDLNNNGVSMQNK